MGLIAFLLLPLLDVVTQAKCIKYFKEHLLTHHLTISIVALYVLIVGMFGIYGPLQILCTLKFPKMIRPLETPVEKLKRIIELTNATRNYLLASFSLFFLLVIWRLFELIIFSARLHEFSDLMANYDLVDIGYAQNQDEDLPVIGIIEDEIEGDDVDAFNWPLVVHLSEKETLRLKSFLEESPRACTLIQRDSVILIPERSELAERIDEIEIPLDCDVENFTILKDSGQLSEVIETKKEPPQQNDKLV
ncbi:hypothetical protein HF086_013802 [Spodoptera exigua]|uniref:Uncharacterized protein n=1 Tax=Spodoptera exigua TaxID=7107 RepID=A0A922MP93_SPOEX|nr:hypothetical protein HF086_013802 [Spodoptera exigua]